MIGCIKLNQAQDRHEGQTAQLVCGTVEAAPKTPREGREEFNCHREDIQQISKEFEDISKDIPKGHQLARLQMHTIPLLPEQLPKYKKGCYEMSEEHLKELKRYLKDLLDKGFIVPSSSQIAAPVFFVNKQDGTLRLVIGYRALNGITVKNEFITPKIQDILNGLSKARWFTKLDLQSGYHQVQVAPEDRWKTAFKMRYGTYEFTVMPFGLSGAPATFQRIMQEIFIQELDDFVAIYLDDILIFSKTREEHIQHVS